ncbi:unnamed protein product [Didymodactylos carnosus]|uniref:Tektin n=1 Tax=Didymodactylos carnosus TaxID=1234261 RepID=A0A813REE9_9BILA|nr:unnamed protein product [Didymodactylos carnosus]CAF0779132.1 unnamed protein product [Didymodactylos carnosus]CAF3494072.1 unnamed protein product [Didymodactylos carnosus]CAF3562093.1 unnamed protein product [Didymodactylos carnosus]
MDYMGSTATAQYTHFGRRPPHGTMLPSIANFDYRTGSAPPYSGLLTRSLSLPWRPSTFYRSARVEPNVSLSQSTADPLSGSNYLNNIDSIKVPPIFPSARQALYTRYTPKDWYNAQMTNYLASDKVRSAAERLRSDAIRLAREKDEQSFKNNAESSKRLGERINDIEFWKNELEKTKDKLKKKIDDVEFKRREVEKQLLETENPLRIAQENLYEREKRQGIDLVHDGVERELIREIDTIKLSQQKLRQMLERLNTQNALNRGILHELEKDSADKFRARVLDSAAHHIATTSRGINFYEGIEGVDNTFSTPESWAKFTEDNIRRAMSEMTQSDELLNSANKLMAGSNNDMWNQWNSVNVSLENRVQEEQTAKNKIQSHLEKVLQEIFDVEQNIEFLKKTIADKEAFLQVAQTRLETRTRRPNVESCRDPAMHRLIQEVHDLHAGISDLHGKLRQEENAVQHLLRTKSTLEQDLAIKNNSLFIDADKVMGIRRTFTMSSPERAVATNVSFSHPRGLISV